MLNLSDCKPIEEFECQICLDKRDIDLLMGFDCGHQFCRICLKNMIELSINDRTVGQKCPQKGCAKIADESIVRLLVSPELFHKYQDMKRIIMEKNYDKYVI